MSHTDMVKELAGTKPLDDDLPSNEKVMAGVTKQMFEEIRKSRKSHDDELATLMPDLHLLYTASSFASSDAIQRSMDVLHRKLDLDQGTSVALTQMPDNVKSLLEKTDLSSSDKEKFLKGFMKSYSSSEYFSARDQMLKSESDCFAATQTLYAFALKHESQIHVQSETISITNDATLAEFNTKLAYAEKLHSDYLNKATHVDEVRAQNLKNSDITPGDIGMKN